MSNRQVLAYPIPLYGGGTIQLPLSYNLRHVSHDSSDPWNLQLWVESYNHLVKANQTFAVYANGETIDNDALYIGSVTVKGRTDIVWHVYQR